MSTNANAGFSQWCAEVEAELGSPLPNADGYGGPTIHDLADWHAEDMTPEEAANRLSEPSAAALERWLENSY